MSAIATRLTPRLRDIDVVFHQAAYGGYMPEIAKYVEVNSLRHRANAGGHPRREFPIQKGRRRTSQAVYSEGAASVRNTASFFPRCGRSNNCSAAIGRCIARSATQPPRPCRRPKKRPVGGETVYGLTKVDQEKLVLLWGKQIGHSDGRAALLLHLRPAPIDLQSLHRRDRDFLHAPAQRSAAGALRRWRTNARFLVR